MLPQPDSDPSAFKDTLSTELFRYRPRRRQRYSAVNVLLITWKDDDLGVADEVNALASVLENEFQYLVWPYQIPSEDSQAQLQLQVAKCITTCGGNDNLIVVFYGGHGGPTPERTDSKCVWAAQIAGGPELDWSIIQPLFLGARCDVAIILDCCYAGQAVRSRSSCAVEFLAATDKDQWTPSGVIQGRPSFTKVLTTELSNSLREHGVVTLPDLHRRLLRKETGLVKQPFYASLSEQSGGIHLARWDKIYESNNELVDSGHKQSPECALSLHLRLSMLNPLDITNKRILLKWMTRDAPSTIEDIQVVESTMAQGKCVEKLGSSLIEPTCSTERIAFPWLSERARQEAMRLLQSLQSALSMPDSAQFDDIDVDGVIRNVSKQSEQLIAFLGDCLTSLDSKSLETLQSRDLYGTRELRSRIEMRLTLLQDDVLSDTCTVSFATSSAQGQRLRIGKCAGTTVLVQYCDYDASSKESIKRNSTQVARISCLLAQQIPPAFRVLQGLGHLHETLHGHRFGLVYKLPSGVDGNDYITLLDLFSTVRVVPLELRYVLAGCICDALLHLHSIGWHHKAIKADNVILLRRSDRPPDAPVSWQSYDFQNPYIIGFDYSRPWDAETWTTVDYSTTDNVYRHPDRWGRSKPFERFHDTYAFGTLLIEIGFWKVLLSMDPRGKEFTLVKDPEKLRDFFLDSVCVKLAHTAGTRFANAVQTCLQRVDWKQHEDWQFQNLIRERVWLPLSKGY